MRKRGFLAAGAAGVVALGVAAYALAGGPGFNHASETLISYEETPAISSVASATFTADLSKDGSSITYELSYKDLEAPITQSHIHFGQRAQTGGISVFLCSNLGNGPAGTQACPPSPATITGTITAADVSPPITATAGARAQGIDTGEFTELLRAMDAGKTYVNVHTTKFPGGEIRAQLNETGDPHD
jgi:CHRD domain